MRSPSNAPPERRRVGIDGEHGDAHVGERVQETQQQFVHHAGFARTTGAGEAEHGRVLAGQLPLLALVLEFGVAELAFLDRREHVADRDLVVDVDLGQRMGFGLGALGSARAGALHHVLDHLDQAELHAVVRVIDALDAVGLQFLDFLGRDGAAAAAEHAHVAGAALAQHVDHVLEVFDVAALVGRQRDRVGVFLQRGAHDIFHRAVVAEVNHFRALRLDDPPHDVDRRVVAIEQAGRGDETQRGGFRLRGAGGDVLGGGTHGNSDIVCLIPSILVDQRQARGAGGVLLRTATPLHAPFHRRHSGGRFYPAEGPVRREWRQETRPNGRREPRCRVRDPDCRPRACPPHRRARRPARPRSPRAHPARGGDRALRW